MNFLAWKGENILLKYDFWKSIFFNNKIFSETNTLSSQFQLS